MRAVLLFALSLFAEIAQAETVTFERPNDLDGPIGTVVVGGYQVKFWDQWHYGHACYWCQFPNWGTDFVDDHTAGVSTGVAWVDYSAGFDQRSCSTPTIKAIQFIGPDYPHDIDFWYSGQFDWSWCADDECSQRIHIPGSLSGTTFDIKRPDGTPIASETQLLSGSQYETGCTVPSDPPLGYPDHTVQCQWRHATLHSPTYGIGWLCLGTNLQGVFYLDDLTLSPPICYMQNGHYYCNRALKAHSEPLPAYVTPTLPVSWGKVKQVYR